MTIEETIKALREGKKISHIGSSVYYRIDKDTGNLVLFEKGSDEIWGCDGQISFSGQDFDGDSTYEIYEGCVLDNKEYGYLSAVIRPFRNDVISIRKDREDNTLIRITITVANDDQPMALHVMSEEWFMGMKEGKEYTPEELDL